MIRQSSLSHKLKYFRLRSQQFLRSRRRPEVRTKDFFGRTLQRVIRTYRPKKILDLGAWDGSGTTTCLLSKLTYEPSFIDCVELIEERADIIEKEIVPLFPFVRVNNCSTLLYDQWSFKDFENDLWKPLPDDAKKKINKSVTLSYWEREALEIKKAQRSYLSENADKYYNLIVLDGGECTGWDEYQLLKGRFDIIAFDDVFKAFKSYLAYHEMLKNTDFELIAASCFVRRGFAVFAKKNLEIYFR